MDTSRRNFLKLLGIAAFGFSVATRPVLNLLSRNNPARAAIGIEPTVPLAGKKWGMAIDITACLDKENCTACIDACHTVHNVPVYPNQHDEIKWIWRAPYKDVFPEAEHAFKEATVKSDTPVTVLCNHCTEPPCTVVCPTRATWKREDGIVMIDYHRCIGCRYCMAGCPYGARSFNWFDPRPYVPEINEDFPTRTRGVVEKCNFCAERLARGQQPACVEACPEALIFGDLEDPNSEINEILRTHHIIQRLPELGTGPNVFYFTRD